MNLRVVHARGFRQIAREVRADWIRKRYVNHQPIAKESLGPLEGPIDKLIRDHQLAGMNFFFQAASSGNRNEMSHPELLHAENVGAVIDLGGKESMAAAVTRQENHFDIADSALVERIGRAAEGCL